MFRLGARCRSGSDTSIGASEANLGDGGRKQGATSKHGNGTKPPPSIWNSSNSGKSGRKRRSSLSSLDEKASALRDSIVKYAGSRTSEPRGKSDNVDAAASSGPGCDFWRNRSSGSLRGPSRSPPPARESPRYNPHRPQRRLSSSVSAPPPRVLTSYDDSLLKPPPRFPSRSAHIRPASLGPGRGYTPPYFESGFPQGAWYPARDSDFVVRTQRSSARAAAMEHRPPPMGAHPTWRSAVNHPAAMPSPFPPYSSSPTSPASPGFSDRQQMYNRPRRLSNSSTATTASTVYSHDSFDPRMRSPAWSSQTSFDSILSGSPRPSHGNPQYYDQQPYHHHQFQRPALIKSCRSKAKPGELFEALPGEVLELILAKLKNLHLQQGSTSCATCWMRDCTSIALSARKWLQYARAALYEDIQLVGADSPLMKKRYKLNYGARMVLLRRTLRSIQNVALLVRSLKVPAVPPGVHPEQYQDLVASVVMACPSLERLTGFYPGYRHEFGRFFHSLSTRQQLKEMDWVLEPSAVQRQQRMRHQENQPGAPGALQPQESKAFLEYHVNWLHLTTLTIHCRPGGTLTPDSVLTNTLLCLPLLQELNLSRLPYNSFNDSTLLQLPPLRKLTLAHLRGVTPAGLSSFATRPNSASIETLTLLHININSLPVLARIFSNLASLATFNLVQTTVPSMAPGESIWLFPYLASLSLRNLHWDVTSPRTAPSPGDVVLARSIAANGFPALRRLRTPNDPEGVFQALCKPQERADLPSDREFSGRSYRRPSHQHHRHESNASADSFGAGNHASSPTSPGLHPSPTSPAPNGAGNTLRSPVTPPAEAGSYREYSDLRFARLAAQERLEEAREAPRYFVDVMDEQGSVVEKHQLGAFMGTVESKIEYVLSPEPGATDETGGLIGVAEFLGDGGELIGGGGSKGSKDASSKKQRCGKPGERGGSVDDDAAPKEGCTGRWNMNPYAGAAADKKDRDRWWHTERGRWRGVSLS